MNEATVFHRCDYICCEFLQIMVILETYAFHSNLLSRVFCWISSLLTTLHQYSWRTSGHKISLYACRSKCESIRL
jgi:hypothetical protein